MKSKKDFQSQMSNNQQISEINMSAASTSKSASSIDAVIGFEFEMGVKIPNLKRIPDYSSDVEIESLQQVNQFFADFVDYDVASKIEQRLRSKFKAYIAIVPVNDSEIIPELVDVYRRKMQNATAAVVNAHVQHDIQNKTITYYNVKERWLIDNGYEHKWLKSIKLTKMSDVCKMFKVEWPEYTYESAYKRIADELKPIVKMDVNFGDTYKSCTREPGKYCVEPDPSIVVDDVVTDIQVEIISPPLPFKDAINQLSRITNWMKKKNAYTNESVGLHINISIPSKKWEDLNFLKLAVLTGEEYVLQSFERLGNKFCVSVVDQVKEKIQNNPKLASNALDLMGYSLDKLASNLLHDGSTKHTDAINVKNGYIEFRMAGNDWLKTFTSKVMPTITRYVVALNAALDPDAHANEFKSKLYKLLAPSIQDDDIIGLFVEYNLGGKSKTAALKEILKLVQQERSTGARKRKVMPLSELTFGGRTCTKDCSGHAAGYLWGVKHKVTGPEYTPSNSFNSGTDIAAKQVTTNRISRPRIKDNRGKFTSGPKNWTASRPSRPRPTSRTF